MEEMNVKVFKTLVMEVRPRLQSVNVYIILNKAAGNINLSLNSNDFDIIIDEKTYKYSCHNLKILADSITLLNKHGKFISFRFLTSNSYNYLGQYKAELLQLNQSVSTEVTQCFINPNKPYEIQCMNCLQVFCKDATFERVLPLPSDVSDTNNWFCHGNVEELNLNPKITDVFYTETYAHINCNLLCSVLKSDKIFVCKRCLSWLGVTVNKETFRIWFNTTVFKFDGHKHLHLPLQDVFTCIRDVLNSSPLNFAKILLTCQISDTKLDYILLWVIEAKLRVIIDCDSSRNDCSMAKVLFRYENSKGTVLDQWKNDTTVCSLDISKPMIIELLKHLYKYNKFLPEEFSVSNEFNVSYLALYENS